MTYLLNSAFGLKARSLGIEGTVPPERFRGAVRPGYNVYSSETMVGSIGGNSTSTIMFSALREHRSFQLTLNDRLNLTLEFISTLEALHAFNSSDPDSVESWKSFFTTYGMHVVMSTHGGGFMEIQVSTQENIGIGARADLMFQLIQFAEDVSTGHIRRNGTNSTATFGDVSGLKHTLKFKGRDIKYHATELTSMTLGAAADLLEN